MILQEKREELIEYGIKMLDNHLTVGTGGNLSICDRASGLMAITPSGIEYREIKPENIAIIEVGTGKMVDGDKVPSSERDMHR
ncbi:MAG TPA: fuculose phosphate aldolase, partial [Clostridiaceae bacterium]|nr:fuculose phosphate aldolase [Clostridiaceae bacterium]